MLQTAVAAPVGVDVVGVGVVDYGQAVFEYVDVAARQTDGYFARSVGAGGVEHHVAAAFFGGT